MKKYIFEEYRDKAGTGSTKVFQTEKEAAAYAEKEWNSLFESDKESYRNDSVGIFRVYEANLPEDEEDAIFSEYETRQIANYLK